MRIFRVDNPHTKPMQFWEWLIREVQDVHPDVVFLSEAFTRPKVMKALAKVGFTQSYTYFTWRNFKHELEEYLKELTQPPVAEYIPRQPLAQHAGHPPGDPAAAAARRPSGCALALAATLSSVYGIYCGYELCEGRAAAGQRGVPRLGEVPARGAGTGPARATSGTTSPRLNRIRASSTRALQLYDNLRFYRADNDRVLFYGKRTPDGAEPGARGGEPGPLRAAGGAAARAAGASWASRRTRRTRCTSC